MNGQKYLGSWMAGLACAVLAMAAQHAHAAVSGVFFSEYVEGSSNNKALEIFNGTGAPLDLSQFQIETYQNGRTLASGPSYTIALSGSLPAADVYVVANSSSAAEILAVTDLATGNLQVNGDDAVVLREIASGEIVDSLGQTGVDPGSAWTSGDVSTANMTLRRKQGTTQGDTIADDSFDPAVEWDGFAQDSFNDLGQYDAGGGGGGGGTSGQCGDPATLISSIQGSGESSPLDGETHSVEAVVTGVFPGLKGFFIEEEAGDQDMDTATSEGVFVYQGSAPTVAVGDSLRVSGKVTEYYGLTEITNATVDAVCGGGSVAAVALSLPLNAADQLESVEGMLVQFPQTLAVTENYNLARYGEVLLSGEGRLMQPTQIATPGAPAIAVADANLLNQILLDDASTTQNPDPVIYPAPALDAANTLRSGDQVTGLTGVMSFGFDVYRVQPVQTPVFVAANPRPVAPTRASESSLRVASFNVLNYFNGDGEGGGFPTSRGASSAEEFTRQRDKIIAALVELDADIVGLMEIENDGNGDTSAIADLVAGLNAAKPRCGQYAFVNPGVAQIGSDEIAVGLLYCTQTVAPLGSAAILDSSVDPSFDDTKNRPALAQTFHELATDGVLTVAVNHLKSKGSDCDDVGDPDTGDGQGNCNLTRTSAAQALTNWLASDPTASGDDDFLIIGDLNAYAMEDPIAAIASAGYVNLLARDHGSAEYSYVFDGASGNLDHALASQVLAPQALLSAAWHTNADEPRALDYNLEYKSSTQQVTYYSADSYRASDHDAVYLDLSLSPSVGFCNGLKATLLGTDRGEVLIGTSGADVIAGLGGNDTIRGLGGDDVICGGDGNDMIQGGAGNDFLFGDAGRDSLSGSDGDDLLDGGDGAGDLANGGAGLDDCTAETTRSCE